MVVIWIVYAIAVVLVLLPVGLFLKNLRLFQPPCADSNLDLAGEHPRISICIPARNEETSIGAALESLVACDYPTLEILVLDDHSEDQTREIVKAWQSKSSMIRLIDSAPLPKDWNGKQHACWQLAQHARYEWLLFLDADVRLTSDALRRIMSEQRVRQVPLISGFPCQETITWSEQILIPMMHYVLLCYLPLEQMRQSVEPSFAAGCGQLFLAKKDDYFSAGGHAEIRGSRHDGIQLPRVFRRNGFGTDVFDATGIARCRMYESLSQVQRGLLKNATEGIANPKLIVPFSILLIGGTWLPIVLLILGVVKGWGVWYLTASLLLSLTSWLPRVLAVRRFSQPLFGAMLHPLAILWFVTLQWIALVRSCFGWQIAWRGRH